MLLFRFLICFPLLLLAGLSLTGLYLFNHAGDYVDEIEGFVSHRTGLNADIKTVKTDWNGTSPKLYIEGLTLRDKRSNEIKGQFDSFSTEIVGDSFLNLSPIFSELTIESPRVHIESLSTGGVKVAGVLIKPIGQGLNKKWQRWQNKAQRWAVNQPSAEINNAHITWVHTDNTVSEFKDINASYSLKANELKTAERRLKVSGAGPKGEILVDTLIRGDVLSRNDWSAEMSLLQGGESAEDVVSKNIEFTVEDGKGEMVIPRMRVQRGLDVLRVFGKNTDYERLLLRLGLTGVIENVRIRFDGSLLDFDNWSIAAVANELSIDGVDEYPKVGELAAKIFMDQSGGLIDFESKDTLISWYQHFEQPLLLDRLSGRIKLILHQQGGYQLALENTLIHHQDIHIENSSAVFDQGNDKQKYLVANLPIEQANLAPIERLFPINTNANFRKWWSNAFVSTDSATGYLRYSGAIGSDVYGSSPIDKNALIAQLNTKNLLFDYGFFSDWPVMHGDEVTLNLVNQGIEISSDFVSFDEVKMQASNVIATIPRLFERDREMVLTADVTGDLPELVKFLQVGPIVKRKNKPEPKEYVTSFAGNYEGNMQIDLPFKKASSSKVKGALNIAEGALALPGGVDLTGLEGLVDYTESALSATDVKASFLGGEVRANISTITPAKPPSIRISGAGNADVKRLEPWVGKVLTSQFDGQTDWVGSLDITPDGISVDVDSSLLGVDIKFPEPLNKPADEISQVNVKYKTSKTVNNFVDITGDQYRFNFSALSVESDSLLDSGQIVCGEPFLEERVGQDGISISVKDKEVDIDQWVSSIKKMSAITTESSSPSFVDRLKRVDVTSNNLTLFEKELGYTAVNMNSNNGKAWSGTVVGDNAEGDIFMQPMETPAVYVMNFKKLTWPHIEDESPHVDFDPSQLLTDDRLPSDMPIVSLTAEDFNALGRNLGELRFNIAPEGDVWKIKDAEVLVDGSKLSAFGEWDLLSADDPSNETGKAQTRTNLSFVVEADRTGRLLRYLGFDDKLDNGSARVLADTYWYGAPYDFALNRVNGDYEIKVDNGSFPSVSPAAGRIFGLLNINALSRRLRLDFNDVFQKGLAFDKLRSAGKIMNGNMELTAFNIFSPAVYVEAQGRIGLSAEDYDMKLLVSPQLGGNVVLLSALASSGAGAVVLLAQQVFQKQINNALVYEYGVTGSWDEPTIEKQKTDVSNLNNGQARN